MPRSSVTQAIYRLTAPVYEAAIGPVMQQFAQNLTQQATWQGTARVLDLGTGTGVLAREIAGQCATVLGVDISMPMLQAAQVKRPRLANLHYLQADANRLACLPRAYFDGALASFGLSETDPYQVFKTTARLLRPGGWFTLQEWGPLDSENEPRFIVDDTWADFITDTPNESLLTFREHLSKARPWDMALQDPDDYRQLLSEYGFTQVWAVENRPVTVHFSTGAAGFLAYALAWAPRAIEVAALAPETHQAFYTAVTTRLKAQEGANGELYWSPLIFRAGGICLF